MDSGGRKTEPGVSKGAREKSRVHEDTHYADHVHKGQLAQYINGWTSVDLSIKLADCYVDSIVMWAGSFILIGRWNRSSRGQGSLS